ncbi:MAG: hypothetical protein ABR520_05935 [Mycobacteriales bacterium]
MRTSTPSHRTACWTLVAAAAACVLFGATPASAHHKAGHDGGPKPKPTASPGRGNGQGQGTDKAAGQSNGFSGTIKVAAIGEDTAPDNNPQPGCLLRVDFYGFNKGTYAVRINAQAPTGSGELLASRSVTITQERIPASKFQTSETFDVRPALAAAGITPAKQGYHVKVTVTDPDKPGNGGKHKVAWLDCSPAEVAAASSTTAGSGRLMSRGSLWTRAGGSGRGATTTTATTATNTAAVRPRVLGTKIVRGSGGGSAVLGDRILPFTGAALLLGLVATGFALVVLGGSAHGAGRRLGRTNS